MKLGKAYIGTSGWKYRHWEGNFYPDDLKKKDQFKYFTEHFDNDQAGYAAFNALEIKKMIGPAYQK